MFIIYEGKDFPNKKITDYIEIVYFNNPKTIGNPRKIKERFLRPLFKKVKSTYEIESILRKAQGEKDHRTISSAKVLKQTLVEIFYKDYIDASYNQIIENLSNNFDLKIDRKLKKISA